MRRFRCLPHMLMLVATLMVPTGCALLPGAQAGGAPGVISPVGVQVSPLKDHRVRVTLAPETASINVPTIHIRAERGTTVIARHAVPWNYRQGIEVEVGGIEQPLQAGDTIAVGTSEVNTYVSVMVSP